MIKAIFFDIDGTLVSFKTHRMPDSTKQALAELKAKGIKLFTASGRHKATVNNLDGWVPDGHIGVNGGMCQIGDEVIYEYPIKQSDLQALVDYMDNRRAFPAIFVQEKGLVMNFNDEESEKIFRLLNFPQPPMGSLRKALEKPTYQVIAFFTESEEQEIMQIMPDCETTRWTKEFTDVVPRGSNKWQGISKVIAHLGITREETMVFGDGGNDIEMLDGAGIGVAMGNADDSVKALADYVTDTVDNDGIMKALQHYGIL